MYFPARLKKPTEIGPTFVFEDATSSRGIPTKYTTPREYENEKMKFAALTKAFSRVLAVALVAAAHSGYAQVTGLEIVADTVHYGVYPDGVNLDGYVTYHVKLICENPTDEISAVYGAPDSGIWSFDMDGCVFQHEFSGWEVELVNPLFYGSFPSLEYDSFMTIGKLNSAEPGDVFSALAAPGLPGDIISLFEGESNGDYFDGGDWLVEDGLLYTLNDAENAFCGSDLRATVAQITTCNGNQNDPTGSTEAFSVELCTQVFIEGDQANIQNVCFSGVANNPCTFDPIDPTVSVLDTAFCAGEVPLVQIGEDGAGNSPVTWELFADGVSQGIQVDNPQWNDLEQDVDYFWAIIDQAGCRDTTDVFSYTLPDPLVFTAQVDQIVECASDTNAIISYSFSGGQVPYVITANGTDTLSLSGLETDLPCGIYDILITDANGCTAGQTLDIPCPEGVAFDVTTTDIACSADCDGTITALATGGTGVLDVEMFLSTDLTTPLETVSGVAPLTLTVEDVCAGVYVLVATDEEGCSSTEELTFDAPNPLVLTIDSVAHIVCGGSCTGQAITTLSGGTGDLSLTLDNSPITEFDLEALCATAGSLLCAVDANGCSSCDTLVVTENTPIELLTTVDNATCIGQPDGSIDYFAQGGTGPLEVFVAPFGTDLDALEGGDYTFTLVDSLGCSLEEVVPVGFDVETDLQLDLNITPVSCFDQADGTVQVNISGGVEPYNVQWSDVNSTTGLTADGLAPGGYLVEVSDGVGCVVDSTFLMPVNPDCIFIATAITPNGDGFNDTWFIGGMEFHPSATVQVYNMWGQLLFEEQGYQTRWDGRYNGTELPVGDYYYYIDLDNGQPAFTGTVTLKY